MKKNSTKKALLMSVLSLLLCFSMLIGTTYAWFTDSVESKNNIITAGNLDIELYYQNDETNDWTLFDSNTNIFKESTLWEPGHTEVVYFKVVNEGSLAFKYQFGINAVDTVIGTNADGDPIKLSEHILFGVENLEDFAKYTDRADAIGSVSFSKLAEGYANASQLNAKAEGATENPAEYVALVVYMPETVGNEANYAKDSAIPQINLGINVFATQLEAEKDSFGDDYDAGAPWTGEANLGWYDSSATEYVLDSADELAGLAALVNGTAASTYSMRSTTVADNFEGKTIKLNANIDMNGLNWTPIGNWDNTFAGTFDGQGYTISNLCINDPEGDGVGFFGVVENATIKNVTFNNVDIDAYSMVAAVVGAAYPANISNVHVKGDIEIVSEWAYVAGIAGYCYYGTQVDNCSVIGNDDMGVITSETRNAVAGITAWLLEGDHKVTNCVAKNLNLTGWTNIGGISGFIHYSNVIDGCTVENVNIIKTREGGNPGMGTIAGGYSYNAQYACTITNNTVNNVTMTGASLTYEKASTLYGSEYGGAANANFVLANNVEENVVNNNLDVNKFVANATELQAALDAATGEYVIYVTADIAGNVTATQKADVKITVYGNNHEFNGVFTVNGKSARYATAAITIKGFNFKAETLDKDAFIRLGGDDSMRYTNNVTVADCTFTGTGFVAVKSYTGGDLNVTLDNLTVNAGMHSLAQLTNVEKGLTITDCEVYSKNGANLNNTLSLTMSGCTFDVTGYAVRFGVNGTVNTEAKSFAITNSTLKSACDDGDAVVIFRDSSSFATLDLTGTTLDGSLKITGNTSATTIVGQ